MVLAHLSGLHTPWHYLSIGQDDPRVAGMLPDLAAMRLIGKKSRPVSELQDWVMCGEKADPHRHRCREEAFQIVLEQKSTFLMIVDLNQFMLHQHPHQSDP
jgi:hypothetical protein